MWVGGEKVLGPAVDVREVAAAAARDEDLAADFAVALEHDDAAAPLPRPRCAEQTRRAAAEDDQIEGVTQSSICEIPQSQSAICNRQFFGDPVKPIFGSSSSSTRIISLILRGTRLAFR